jgi:cyclically-permuted mutarotase family protein
MTQRALVAAACLLAACSAAVADEAGPTWLRWSQLPPLPPAPGATRQIGLAGAFAGVHNAALLVAGGANFPDAAPWRGGTKAWWDDVFVLVQAPGGWRWLTDARYKLPRPLAYGAAVSTDDGIVCIGGCDASQCRADVFRLGWQPDRKQLITTKLPSLPRPLAFLAAARIGSTIYVAGGQETTRDARATRSFLALDLARKDDPQERGWKELPAWPGPPRIVPIAAAQSDGAADCLYVFSGRNVTPGKATEPLSDAYRYHPATRRWQRLADIAPIGEAPRCVMAGTGLASGANHILVFGGADGGLFLELERLDRRAGAAADEAEKKRLIAESHRILEGHPGFSRDILAYHTITDTWARIGELPTGSHVTTAAVRWGESIVIPSGEIHPGVRTPQVWRADAVAPRRLGATSWAVLGAYLLVLVAMGVYFSRREKTTEDFFKAGGRIPWWAAGLSIFGTQLSAITFMAIPAKTFATDWRYFLGNMAIVMAAPLIVLLFLPFYRRLNVTTAYEYLERRFNLATRLLGSAMFMLFQLGRIGIVLFLPSLALSVVTGMNVHLCIVVMGALCIFYTVLGGIEAVVWTDVLQVVVLLGGGLLCLVLIPFSVPGGWNAMNDVADAAGKLRVLDFRFDLTTATFWVMVFGGLGANLISYGSDQTVIQRYLTTRDERAAARGIWTNAILCIPASLLFFGIGTALFAFYKSHPQAMSPTVGSADAIFPWYIVTQLPPAAAGLLIAGVFAAAMSSLDSSMNSVATAFTSDFYRRWRAGAPDRTCLRLARGATAAVGLLGTALALLMARWHIQSLWDQFATFLGLFGGGLGGLFLLAIFTRRAHGLGAIVGLLASGAVQFALQRLHPLHPWFYAVTGIASCFVIGYVASLVIPARGKPLAGLTLHTIPDRATEGTWP